MARSGDRPVPVSVYFSEKLVAEIDLDAKSKEPPVKRSSLIAFIVEQYYERIRIDGAPLLLIKRKKAEEARKLKRKRA